MIGTTIGNSLIWDNGTNVGIGNTNTSYTLDVSGTGRFSSSVTINTSAVNNYDLNIYNTIPRIQLQNPTSGTATTDGFHIYQSGSDSYILNKEAANLYLGSNNGINLTIASTGAATFSSNLVAINGNGLTEFKINNNTSEWELYMPSGGTDLRLYRGSDKVTFLANGNVGIGTSSTGFNPAGLPLVVGSGSGNTGLTIFSGTSSSGSIHFADTETTGGGSFSGYINYDHSGNSMQFGTNSTERMRITSNGTVGIGITTGTYNGRLCIEGAGSSTSNIHLEFLTDTNRSYIQSANRTFIANAPLTIESSSITLVALGSGAVTATSGVLSTTSDMNLKIEDGYIDNALEKVLKLIPRYFLWKEESGLPTDLRQLGFYAQEVNEALGEEVANTPKTEKDSWGIYDRGIIAMLTKAIQELKAEIDELKNK